MARTALTAQAVIDTGLEATYAAANVDGHSIPGDGRTILQVINADGSDKTVTVQTGRTYFGKAIADTAVVVTAGEERFIGVFEPQVYNQSGDGQVYVDFSAVTSVTIAALKV